MIVKTCQISEHTLHYNNNSIMFQTKTARQGSLGKINHSLVSKTEKDGMVM